MNTYIIRELQNLHSTRAGTEITANTYAGAELAATNMQMFQGTYMTISNSHNELIAFRDLDGNWNWETVEALTL